MKKILLILFCSIFLTTQAQTLKGGISEDYIPKGFFGSWGVISKLTSSNNPTIFNFESRDIWTLSGYSNILILENLESGAHSEITIKDKYTDGKTLKFERQKVIEKNNKKIIQHETAKFTLSGNIFSGTDNFVIETYKNNELIKKDTAEYKISGTKISGQNPQ